MHLTRTLSRFAVALAILSASPSALAQQTGGSVQGRVVNNVTGEGIRRATVTLRSVGGGRQAALSATSDAGGSFRLQGVPPGSYALFCQKQGFLAQRFTYTYSAARLDVAAGDTTDAGECRLDPQAVITGRVIDKEGEALQRVSVAIFRRTFRRGQLAWAPAGGEATNDLGEFRIPDVTPGIYILAATPRRLPATSLPGQTEHEAGGYVRTFHPSSESIAGAATVEVRAGEILTNVNVEIRWARLNSISGRVIDPAAQGQVRVNVAAIQGGGAADSQRFMAATRPDGTFRIEGVPSGSYLLTADSITPGPDRTRRLAIARMEVNSDVRDAVLEFRPGSPISGTVSYSGTGPAPDMKSVEIMFNCVESGLAIFRPLTARPNPSGAWSVQDVPPCRYHLSVVQRGPLEKTPYLSGVNIGGEDYLGKLIELGDGPAAPINLVLSTASGTIAAQVEETGGLRPSSITARPADERFRAVQQYYQATSLSGDVHLITGLPPGEYSVLALVSADTEIAGDPDIWKELQSRVVKARVEPGQTTSVSLKPVQWPPSPSQR